MPSFVSGGSEGMKEERTEEGNIFHFSQATYSDSVRHPLAGSPASLLVCLSHQMQTLHQHLMLAEARSDRHWKVLLG